MNIFDLYTDYLQITLALATATTRLSRILDKAVSHDQVTRMLANHESMKLYAGIMTMLAVKV